MKHIKLYENYQKPLYWQVDDSNEDGRKEEKIDQFHIDDIKKRLKEGFSIRRMPDARHGSWCRIKYDKCRPGCKACLGLGTPGVVTFSHSPETDFYVDIFELYDEFFDLEYLDALNPDYGKYKFNSEYYRCDGYKGLVKFLFDEKIIQTPKDLFEISAEGEIID
jgi:hypothetical protein